MKLVAVGNSASEKTALLFAYIKDGLPDEYVPTFFDNYIEVDGKVVGLDLWDTPPQEDCDRLRPLSYPNTDVFLICFGVDDCDSLDSIKEKWQPEVTHNCPGVPFLLVGTKIELRSDPDTIERLQHQKTTCVTYEEGQAMARNLGAQCYLECSAETGEGVNDVFQTAARVALKNRLRSDSKDHSHISSHLLGFVVLNLVANIVALLVIIVQQWVVDK